MLSYIIRRVMVLIPLLFIVSIISYVIIELPPGDILTMRIMQLRKAGTMVGEAEIAPLTPLSCEPLIYWYPYPPSLSGWA